MNTFQILMLMATAFFAFKVYEHVNSLEDKKNEDNDDSSSKSDVLKMIEEADSAYENKDLNKAEMILTEAFARDRDSSVVLNKLAFIQAAQNKNDIALTSYQASLKINDKDASTHLSLASLYRKMGDLKKSAYHYNESFLLDDTDPIAFYNYGNLLVDLEDYEKAELSYKRALELDPNFKEAKEALEELEAKND